MNTYQLYYLTSGGSLFVLAALLGWSLHRVDVHIAWKICLVSFATVLALVAPTYIKQVMGLPLWVDFESLPDSIQILSMYENVQIKTVDLWIIDLDQPGTPPKAVEVAFNQNQRRLLKDGMELLQHGKNCVLSKEESKGNKNETDNNFDDEQTKFKINKKFNIPLKRNDE